MVDISPKFFERCETCAKHTKRTYCCCDKISTLTQQVGELERISAGNEKFRILAQKRQEDSEFAALGDAAEWCEANLLLYQSYLEESENKLIELQMERWLCTEVLQICGVNVEQPLREAIIELVRKLGASVKGGVLK